MNGVVVEVRGLTKSYRVWHRREIIPAVRGVSFAVRHGEVFGFIGPNGAGKTTTIKLLLGLLTPDSGAVTVFGGRPGSIAVKRRVGYMPERSLLPGYLRLEEMVRLFGSLSGLRGKALRRATDEAIATVNLTDSRRRLLETFSKGMLQRASLAQALVANPDLLLLDEPAIGLDPIARRDLRLLIRRLRDEGRTVFLNSHELEMVAQVCDRFAILNKGQVLAEEPIQSLRDIQRYVIELHEPPATIQEIVASLDANVEWRGEPPRLHLTCGGPAGMNRFLDALRARNLEIAAVNPYSMTLEELFMRYVQSNVAEAAGSGS